ncbi:MAG: hypothetical protein OXU23_26880 [Candidatus Poribacteria bacterium]|nr:hypothetical protein [Candidatus Poribacteria bacterium]
MNDDSKNLCFLGGVTSVLSGLSMIFLSYWFGFQPESTHDAMHGISVVTLILVVPTIVATTVLLIKDAQTSTLLGVGFATLWIVLELIAHCSQTSPLKTVNQLIQTTATEDFGNTFNIVWQEWGKALTLISAFLFSVSALCYGVSLRSWGNSVSAYLLIFSAIVFAVTFTSWVDFYWHILVRGIAFIFLGGVLMQASRETIDEEWEE